MKYFTTAETAKLIRKALKESFSGHKFSVRSKVYSGGSSITVSWVDGPTDDSVTEVVGVFNGATFDGMTDMKSYVDSVYEGEEVSFGADYIFTSRCTSNETQELLQKEVAEVLETEYEAVKMVEAAFFEGEICKCTGTTNNMSQIARRKFNVTAYPFTKEKLESSYL